MQFAFQTLCRPTLSLPLAGSFLRWYFLERPWHVVGAYGAYAKTFGEIFSPVFLLCTLFKPWKNIMDAYPSKGLNLNAIAQAFTLNCVSRVIGAIFRLSALCLGIVLQVALLVGIAGYLLLWMLFPLVFLVGLVFLLLAFL